MDMRTTGRCGLKPEGTGGRCSSEAFDKKRWVRHSASGRATDEECKRWGNPPVFIGMKARNITVKTGNLEIHAKGSDKKTEVNQFLVQKIFRIT